MLPSLQLYLPHTLYEPMERRATADDLEAAVLEGATIVRVGTALFGPRPTRPLR